MPLAVQLISGPLLHQRAAGARERRQGPGRRHHEGGGRGQAKGEKERTTHAERLEIGNNQCPPVSYYTK
eukprot:scaffold39584_cov31-Phaeocystis_antarctica.AAC.2